MKETNRAMDNGLVVDVIVRTEQDLVADRKALRKLGIYTPDTLLQSIEKDAKKPFQVEGLLRPQTVNLLVGDSGLGKTPLAIQLGVSIAAGLPVFGRSVRKGRVLYCDAESGKTEFCECLAGVSRFLGLSEPPSDFHVWSPNWEVGVPSESSWQTPGSELKQRVDAVKPALVVVDALRTFWPEAEAKNPQAAETLRALRKFKDATWLLIHHRRKVNHERAIADLSTNPNGWFQESAGSLALVNQSDTRIGVEPHSQRDADLLVAGFVRGTGPFVHMDLVRVLDDDGNPVGYRALTGAQRLNTDDQAVYQRLPDRFRFKDVERELGGTSGSNAARFLKRCESLQIVKKVGKDYTKSAPVEYVERVECSVSQTPSTPSTPLEDLSEGPESR